MSNAGKNRSPVAPQDAPQPMDVVDGIPDRASRAASWKRWLLGAVFLLWLGLLIYLRLAH